MAVNTSRSMTAELFEGATDGKYRKAYPNRGGDLTYDETLHGRADLKRENGFGDITTEKPAGQRELPDGRFG